MLTHDKPMKAFTLNNIKRLALLALLTLVVVSCQKGLERYPYACDKPQLNFNTFRYTLGKEELSVELTAEKAPQKELRVGFELVGTAQRDVDYSLEDDAFVFKPGETTARLTFKRKDLKASGYILLSLKGQDPEGYVFGLKNYTQIELLGEDALIYSFEKDKDELDFEKGYNIIIQKITGGNFRPDAAVKYALVVDPESTAIEGEHFEFVGGEAVATVPRRRNVGTFKLKFLKKEAGRDKLVLGLAPLEGYAPGTNAKLEISITGPHNFSGTWDLLRIANERWIDTSWGDFGVKANALVSLIEGDYMVLRGDSYQAYDFEPHFGGLLRNYFTKPSRVSFAGGMERSLVEASGRPPTISLNRLDFDKVNVHFSETNVQEKKASVGLRFITTEQDGQILEMTIDDFIPLQDGWKDIYEFNSNMHDVPIRLHFKLRP